MNHDREPEQVEITERSRRSAQELSCALRSTNRAAAAVDHALAARIGLRDLDYSGLAHVMSQERAPLGPAELGNRLGISTGSATELVDRLERAGHIYRSRDDTDRRRVALRPHEAAVARILGVLKPLFDSLDAITTEFTDDEQAVVARYLRRASHELSSYAASISRAPGSDRSAH